MSLLHTLTRGYAAQQLCGLRYTASLPEQLKTLPNHRDFVIQHNCSLFLSKQFRRSIQRHLPSAFRALPLRGRIQLWRAHLDTQRPIIAACLNP